MKVLAYLKKYWFLVILIIGLTYLQVTVNLQLPDYMASIVNEGIIGQNQAAILHYGWLMIAVSFGGAIAVALSGLLSARVAAGFGRNVRRAIFAKVESFSSKEFNQFSTASLLTRSTNDVQQVQQVLVMLLRMVLMAPFMAIVALQKAMSNAPALSWLIWLAVGVLLAVIIFLFAVVFPKFGQIQKLLDKLNLVARENLTGLRVIRAFHKEAREEMRFERVNTRLTNLNLFVNRMMGLMNPMMTLVFDGALLGIMWFGARLIDAGEINIGNLLAFMQYATQVIMSFLMLSMIFIMVPRAIVSARRINEVLAKKLSIKNKAQPKAIDPNGAGRIVFDKVSFAYSKGESILHDISFTAEPGQTTAIIGGTGSGKSTLIKLIPRLYDVSAGKVTFDGVDVRDLDQQALRAQIGFVPQKATLFSGTVASNVAYGKPRAKQALIKKAIAIAQARDFVEKMPDGLKSSIAQGGANVSGGQKQRLAIARALAVEPKVFVFDDSFSALDLKTDRALREALAPVTKNSTVIIVAQRIGTILHADKIVVLDQGKLVGMGTHNELMRSCAVYQEIAKSQLSDDELASLTAAESAVNHD